MEIEKDLCCKCLEPIINPICPECYLKHISLWIRDQNFKEIEKTIILNKIKKRISYDSLPGIQKCILCEKNYLTICSYCFFLISAQILKELNFPSRIISEFLEVFNYRFGEEEYFIEH